MIVRCPGDATENQVEMADHWIVIRNWDRFQHYRDRRPPWIKCYLELMSDDAYLELSSNRRALLHGLWMTFALSRGVVTANTRRLSELVHQRVTSQDLQALSQAGFIQLVASKPLALPLAEPEQDASARATRANALARGREKKETVRAVPSLRPSRANEGSETEPGGTESESDEKYFERLVRGWRRPRSEP